MPSAEAFPEESRYLTLYTSVFAFIAAVVSGLLSFDSGLTKMEKKCENLDTLSRQENEHMINPSFKAVFFSVERIAAVFEMKLPNPKMELTREVW